MALDRLLGTWATTMRHVALPEEITGRQTFERVLGGAFVEMRSSYEHDAIPDAIAYLDASAYHYFDVRGIVRTFDLTVTDDSWSIIRRDDDFWQRSTTTFVGDDRMELVGDNSHDEGATWQLDIEIAYRRVD